MYCDFRFFHRVLLHLPFSSKRSQGYLTTQYQGQYTNIKICLPIAQVKYYLVICLGQIKTNIKYFLNNDHHLIYLPKFASYARRPTFCFIWASMASASLCLPIER